MVSIPVETGATGDVDFRPDDGAILLAIGKNAEVYSLADEKRLLSRLIGHELSLRTVMFDQTGTRALTWGDSSTRVWDLSAERNEVSFVSKGVTLLAFSKDGQELANDDGPLVRVTRVTDGHLLRTIPLVPRDGPVLGMTYPQPHQLMVVQASGRVTVWGEDNSAALLGEHFIDAPLRVCFSDAAQAMAVLRRDQSVVLLGYSDGEMLSSIPPSRSPVQALGCSANGGLVAEGTWNPNRATIWDTQTRRNSVQTSLGITTTAVLDRSTRFQAFSDFLHNLSVVTTTGFYENTAANGFLKLKFNSDGSRLLSMNDFAARMWDTKTGDMVQLYRAKYGGTDASWSADGNLVATAHASHSGDQAACIWDTKSGSLAAEIPNLHTEAKIIEFSPDGRRLAVGDGDGVVHIYARGRFAPIPEALELIQQRTSRPLETREWKLNWLWR
jgi:WD40 repeat protein